MEYKLDDMQVRYALVGASAVIGGMIPALGFSLFAQHKVKLEYKDLRQKASVMAQGGLYVMSLLERVPVEVIADVTDEFDAIALSEIFKDYMPGED